MEPRSHKALSIHWHESAMDLHPFTPIPIPLPPPSPPDPSGYCKVISLQLIKINGGGSPLHCVYTNPKRFSCLCYYILNNSYININKMETFNLRLNANTFKVVFVSLNYNKNLINRKERHTLLKEIAKQNWHSQNNSCKMKHSK